MENENGVPPVGRAKDITGQRFGRWTVVRRDGTGTARQALWLCECDCGSFKTVSAHVLRKGQSRSCGCLHREVSRENFRAHNADKPGCPFSDERLRELYWGTPRHSTKRIAALASEILGRPISSGCVPFWLTRAGLTLRSVGEGVSTQYRQSVTFRMTLNESAARGRAVYLGRVKRGEFTPDASPLLAPEVRAKIARTQSLNGTVLLTCDNPRCGRQFRRKRSLADDFPNHYCSRACHQIDRGRAREERIQRARNAQEHAELLDWQRRMGITPG